jgi:hypothetical protein
MEPTVTVTYVAFMPTTTTSASQSIQTLSSGAVAGIVLGTIAGIFVTLLLCFCCVLKRDFRSKSRTDLRGSTKRVHSISRAAEVSKTTHSKHAVEIHLEENLEFGSKADRDLRGKAPEHDLS